MCIDTVSLPDVSRYGDMYIDIHIVTSLHTYVWFMYVL